MTLGGGGGEVVIEIIFAKEGREKKEFTRPYQSNSGQFAVSFFPSRGILMPLSKAPIYLFLFLPFFYVNMKHFGFNKLFNHFYSELIFLES